jgi:Tfp pilus assembly protein PilF
MSFFCANLSRRKFGMAFGVHRARETGRMFSFRQSMRMIISLMKETTLLIMALLVITLDSNAQSNSDQPTYVGNSACAKCHSSIYDSYSRHPMALDSGPVENETQIQKSFKGSFRHKASSIYYKIYKEDNRILFGYERSDDPTTHGKQELNYFVGSGRVGRSYLYSLDGYLYQAPVSYYAQKDRWDISPGYESDTELPVRPIEKSCLFCHAGEVRHLADTLNRYGSPAFSQNGVSCERCHGPGSEHIRGLAKMVNPAKLDPERRDSVCAQCHLLSEVRILKSGRDLYLFRPGDLLSDYVSHFVYANSGNQGLRTISHVEEIAQSTCKRKSGNRMSCISCHDPHYYPPPERRVSYFREKCLACHQTQATAWQTQHFSQQFDCIGCHMQKTSRGDVSHAAASDHRISRLPLKQTTEPQAGESLIGFGSKEAESPRELGLAYAELALRTNNSRHKSEAFRLLNEVLPKYPKDIEVLIRLAYLYQERGEFERARTLYEAALTENPHQSVAAVNLGAIYARENQLQRAIELWVRALDYDPSSRPAGINLAEMLCSKGDQTQARLILRKLLRINPDLRLAKQLLRDMDGAKSPCRA